MSYDWPRIHKTEDYLASTIYDLVSEHVLSHFDVDDVEDLTEEQINEVIAFREELNEYSPLQWGYSDLISYWENQ